MTLDQKLLLYAQQFEDQHAPENITTTLREAAAEIERLRAWNAEIALNAREFAAENEKLRKDMVHIRADNFMLREELNNQEDLNDSFREENESLRAALEDILSYVPHGDLPLNLYDKARAALEGRT